MGKDRSIPPHPSVLRQQDEFRLVLLKRRAEDADRLEERLGRLQWSGTTVLRDYPRWLLALLPRRWRLETGNCCPVCRVTPHGGHQPDCWLGLELHGHRHTSG